MTSYDETVIIEVANRLYRRARSVVLSCTLIGGLLGAGAAGIAGGLYAARYRGGPGSETLIVVGAIGGLLGYIVGRDRAFALRLQAQTALCQAQIERNTRAA